MKIYIDYDTTLVNLIDEWLIWINKNYKTTLSSNDITRWYFLGETLGENANDFWKNENHYKNVDLIKPFSNAIVFFKLMQNKFGHENVFIISSTRDHQIKDKLSHISYYFDLDKSQIILTTKNKYNLTKDGILIDDYPLHVMEHIYFNKKPAIIFNYQDRFAWCNINNFSSDDKLPQTLKVRGYNNLYDFYLSINKKNLHVVNDYEELFLLTRKLINEY